MAVRKRGSGKLRLQRPDSLGRITRLPEKCLGTGIRLGGPQAWKDRPGFTFFQGPGETQLIQSGARENLAPNHDGGHGPQGGAQPRVAPIEGAPPH